MIAFSQILSHGVRARQRGGVGAFALVIGAFLLASSLGGEVPRPQAVPTIEPRFTRLFGADSLTIGSAVISPNGKWVAFTHVDRAGAQNVWIAPAEGGEPRRVTRGGHYDDLPTWFPGSNRIAFRSDRVAFDLMTIPIDPDSGQPTGPPRQVTIGGIADRYLAVSPDGKWIAYVTGGDSLGLALGVLPATGGRARKLLEWPGVDDLTWAPDGHIYIVTPRVGSALKTVVRVAVQEVAVDTVSIWGGSLWMSRDAQYVYHAAVGESLERKIELVTVSGRGVAQFQLPSGMRVPSGGFRAEPGTFLAVSQDVVAPLKVLPVAGGPVRQLDEPRASDWPLGWSPDSKRVLFQTELDGRRVLLIASLSGAGMEQIRLPEPWLSEVRMVFGFDPVLSGDGRYVLYGSAEAGPTAPMLKIFNLEDGRARVLSHSPWTPLFWPGIPGAGGNLYRDGESFVYCEKSQDGYEFRTSTPEGASRLIWRFPAVRQPPPAGIYRDRIAFTETSQEESTLLIARVGDREARRVLTVDGLLKRPPVWSHDGRFIAAPYYPRADPDRETSSLQSVLLVEVTPAGELHGDARVLNLAPGPAVWWSLQWLPDASGFLVVGYGASAPVDTDVWLVPLDPGAHPVALTADDLDPVWGFVLSPDGRHIAYASQTLRGSSVWRVELEGVPEEADRRNR